MDIEKIVDLTKEAVMDQLIRPAYLNARQAAVYLGMSSRVLEEWRIKGGGPPFYRVNARVVRYAVEDLDDFMAAKRVG